MKREFLINLLLLVFINILIKPVFIFGIDLQVQIRMEESAYGLYFALLNLSYLLQVLSDFGIQSFNNRLISQYPRLLQKYFPDLVAIKIILSVLFIGITLLAGIAARYHGEALLVLAVLAFNLALIQFNFFLRSNVSGLGHYRIDSFMSSLDKLIMLVTGGVLVWVPGPWEVSILNFAWSQTIAQVFTTWVLLYYVSILGKFRLRVHWGIFSPRLRARLWYWLKMSAPYALVILLMTAYTRLDGFLLERMLPDGVVHNDVFAGAYRLLDASNMLGYLFASLLLPMFARMLGRGESVKPLAGLSYKLIFSGSITVAAAVTICRGDLVRWMMPSLATPYRADTLGILIWAFVPMCTTYIFSTLLTANQQLRQLNRFFIWGILLDVLLNVLLVPTWQAIGSALVTVITQTFIAVGLVVICFRSFQFSFPVITFIKMVVFAGAVLVFDGLLWHWMSGLPGLRFVCMLAFGPVAMLATGLFPWRQSLRFLRSG